MSEKHAYCGWAVAALLAGLIGLPATADADRKLSGSEIRAAAPGKWSGSYRNVPMRLNIARGGRVDGYFAGVPRSGTWRVTGNQFCLTFRAITDVKTRCGAIHMNGKTLYGFFKKGKPRLFLKRV